MFGESGGGRSIGSSRTKPKGSSSALLSRQSNAIGLQFYSTHEPSRICSNPLKTNDRRQGYPSQNQEDNSPGFRTLPGKKFHSAFFRLPVRSKLAREGSFRNRDHKWLAHHSR